MKVGMLLAMLLGLTVLAGGLEWHGHHRGYADGAAAAQKAADSKVAAAQAHAALADAERDAARNDLTNVLLKLDAQRQQLETREAIAQAALDANAALQRRLEVQAQQRQIETEKVAHDDPQCADLARLPVCPAVARRLWGAAAVGAPGQGH